jgi:NDP-sugar pyrophosphorylase family protein
MNFSDLFDLRGFLYPSLFEGDLWKPLQKMPSFFSDFDFNKKEGDIHPSAEFLHPELVSIGKNSVIGPNVYIEGPCVIGENCSISHGAYLRKNLIISNNVHIGHATEIKNSIILPDSKITHFVYLGDSIVGKHVNLGAGVKCANLRLDRQEILVLKQKTGLTKIGAFIGDGSQLGCNCVINPGTVIKKNSFFKPLSVIRTNV